MSDVQELAQYYQDHMDDPDLWEEPEVVPARARGTLGATITVRFSPDEADLIRRRAKQAGVPYSEVVRQAVHDLLHPRFTVQQGLANQLFVVGKPPVPQDSGFTLAQPRQPMTTSTR
jgi:predicted DNA binding CopG/RHH family protein